MALFYSGSATIDGQMGIRRADESFYKYMGQNIYGSIRSCIHPDDFHCFQDAFDEVKSERVSQTMVAVRKINPDNSFEWLLIELTPEPFQVNGVPLFHLNLSPLSQEQDESFRLCRIKEEYETFINLLGGTLLTYDIGSNLLTVFNNYEGQKISLFQGALEKWRENLRDKLDEEYLGEFDALCREMEAGNHSFKHHIKTSAFSKDGSMEMCTIKCRFVADAGNPGEILGCITVSGSSQPDITLNAGYSMDIGIPVLDKKSITEYARKCLLTASGKVHLIILDLDDFKVINDTYGHMVGDEVLIKSANIIKDAIGSCGIVGRIGGDEMMIVLNRIENHAELRNMLRSIRTGIEWAYKNTNSDLHITCSIGVATYPDHGDNYDRIFQLADRMLYIAKNKGKNRYVIYTPELHDKTVSPDLKNDADKNNHFEALRDDKAGVMQRLVNEFLIRKIVPYSTVLTEIGYCFELDEIMMVYENMKLCSLWNHDGFVDDFENRSYLTLETGFLEGFNKDNILIVNGIFNLEENAPVLSHVLAERGVESALFYKMVKNGTMFGYIMFAKKNRRQMWSELDKTLLATAGKVIELSFTG
ncbi:MAG: GGDEF domain-containing protein [Suilimivivens sp.]